MELYYFTACVKRPAKRVGRMYLYDALVDHVVEQLGHLPGRVAEGATAEGLQRLSGGQSNEREETMDCHSTLTIRLQLNQISIEDFLAPNFLYKRTCAHIRNSERGNPRSKSGLNCSLIVSVVKQRHGIIVGPWRRAESTMASWPCCSATFMKLRILRRVLSSARAQP